MHEKSFLDITITRRGFLSMTAAALPLSALAVQPATAWDKTARWLHSGRIGALRTIYMVLLNTDVTSPRQHAEKQLQEMLKALNLPTPFQKKCFEDQKTFMYLLKFPNHLEMTLHLSPAPPPGPEITINGTSGCIEISHGIAHLIPLP